MKIVDINVRVFVYKTRNARDRAGHSHPGEETDAEHALLTIVCDDGTEGYCLYQPEVIRPYVIDRLIKPILIGQDPFERERLWQEIALRQRGSAEQLTDRAFTAVELALWDLAGRKLGHAGAQADRQLPRQGAGLWQHHGRRRRAGRPVLAGGLRPLRRDAGQARLQGDQAAHLDALGRALARPEAGRQGVRRGARGGRPRHRADARRLSLVQPHRRALSRPRAAEARLSPGTRSRWRRRACPPMSGSPQNLDIPILGPEVVAGKHYARAEWAKSGACDIMRTGVFDVGGIDAEPEGRPPRRSPST